MILPPFESSFYCLGQSIFDIWKKQLSKLAITSFLCFFFNLEIFRSSLLQQSPSNLRCYSGVLPLVVPVAPFHQLKHDEMRGWIYLVLQCWVIFVSWLNQKISVGWNVRPEFFEKRESGCQCFNEHFLPSETARPSFIDWKTAGHLFSSPNKTSDHKRGT